MWLVVPSVPTPAPRRYLSPVMPTPRRADTLSRLAREPFDLLVIGGGINGAGIARDAALRGLSVALVERDDFASGTSSRSSRLIHGGVRYLEHGYLHLVFEASRERRILLDTAPHLVQPLAFTWPVFRGDRIPRWKLGAGLWLYDLLATFKNVDRHRSLSAAGVLEREPHVRRNGLRGGALYYDAATNDARLTIANIIDAATSGAAIANYCAVTALTRDGARVTGATVRDVIGGGEFAVRARRTVNAAGPWSDTIRQLDEAGHTPGVQGTKGVHIEVPRDRVGNREAVTVISQVDGRVMFVLPAGAHTIIGTTDTPTVSTPDNVRADEGDVDYLLRSANGTFPDARLTRDDVISAWAGIRPLIASGSTGSPASASREHAIHSSVAGLISVSGGKLTTYRSMSAEVVDVAERALGRSPARAITGTRALPRSDPDALIRRDVTLAEPVVTGLPHRRADFVCAAESEFACRLGDFMIRRTHVAFETRDHGRAAAPEVARLVAPVLGWTDADITRELATYDAEVRRLFSVDPR